MPRLMIVLIVGAVALLVLCGLPLLVVGLVFNVADEDLNQSSGRQQYDNPFLPPSQRVSLTLPPIEFRNPDECLTEDMTDLPVRESFTVVDRVLDGDTVMALEVDNPMHLWGIDAPELGQPGGQEAATHLGMLIPPGEVVKRLIVRENSDGQELVILGDKGAQAVNNRMVAAGWAFHNNSGDSQRNPCLYTAQRYARDLRLGLWANYANGGVRPWDWRRGVR